MSTTSKPVLAKALTPLQAKIVEMLERQPRQRMDYHEMMHALWPPAQHPKAWRYSSNGGPPGCAMSFGRADCRVRHHGLAGHRK